MSDTKLSLKLLIDKKSQRVLFAEADKKFIDFLLVIFALPIGTVTRLLQNQDMAGCLGTLYESIETLSDMYFLPGRNKDFVLKPQIAIPGASVPLLLGGAEESYPATKFYGCGYCSSSYSVTTDQRAICPSCKRLMNRELRYVNPPSDTTASSSTEEGYVKGVITYMVMDDLEMKPMSTISSITLLSKFDVTDVRAVEEKVVDFGMDEGVRLLGASLHSKTVLSDVFLRNPVKKMTLSKEVK